MIKAVIFDSDGTLLDTREYIFSAYEYTFKKLRKKSIPRNKLSRYMGGQLREIYAKILPGIDMEILVGAHKEFQEKNPLLVKAYPKVVEAVKTIKDKGYKLAVVTSRVNNAKKNLTFTGLIDFMDTIVTGDDVVNFKPHPEPVLKALKHINIRPSEAIMIGDSHDDIMAGKNAGTMTIGITHGFFSREFLTKYNPDYLADNITEVVEILRKIIK